MHHLSNEQFVSEAYLRILGRPADPAGYLTYLRALRLGLPRNRLVKKLKLSDEALARSSSSVGETQSPHSLVAVDLWPKRKMSTVSRLRSLIGSPVIAHTDFQTSRSTPRSQSPEAGQAVPAMPRGLEADIDSSMAGTAAFTIATRNYLPFVQVLMTSLTRVHPDFHLFLVLVDEPNEPESMSACVWKTLRACDLQVENFDDMSIRYDVVELCTALKPFVIRWLLERTLLQTVIYIDPDVRIFSKMDKLTKILNTGVPMVLTPHITEPLTQPGEPTEHTILKSGVYNLGFIAVQRDQRAAVFLDWWCAHLRTEALVDIENNLFTDQRWCDMAPALVPGLAILLETGYNVAYWNLPQRKLSKDSGGQWQVDGHPLVFFHFSGFNPTNPKIISKYQTRLDLERMGDAQQLFLNYSDELFSSDWSVRRSETYFYDQIDGVRISKTIRKFYRTLHKQPSNLSRIKALQELASYCGPSNGEASVGDTPLTPMMRFVHASRLDLVLSFDLATHRGRQSYEGWFWSTGVVEHGLVGLHRRARAFNRRNEW